MLPVAVGRRGSRASVGARLCLRCLRVSGLALSRLSRPRVRAGASPSAVGVARRRRPSRASRARNGQRQRSLRQPYHRPRVESTRTSHTTAMHGHGAPPTATRVTAHGHSYTPRALARPPRATADRHTPADPPVTPLGTFTSSLQEAPGSAAPRMQVPCHGDAMTDPDMLREGCCRVR